MKILNIRFFLESKMLVFPIPKGSLGIIDGIYVKEIRIPSKPCLLNHHEYGIVLKNKPGLSCAKLSSSWASKASYSQLC